MMKRSVLRACILSIIAASLLMACSDGKHYDIGLELVTPIDQDPFQSMKRLTFTVTNASDSDKQSVFPYEPDGGFSDLELSLSDIDYYPEFTVLVEGRDPEETLLARGATGILAAQTFDGSSFAVYFARTGTISSPPAQMLHPRAGVRVASPNDFDVLIVGGAGRLPDGTWQDTLGQIAYFTPPLCKMDLLMNDDDIFYLNNGMIGHTATPLDGSSVLVAGGYALGGEEATWLEQPVILSSEESDIRVEVGGDAVLSPRIRHQASLLLAEERVLLSGGENPEGARLDGAFYVDSTSHSLNRAFSLKTPRAGHTQTVVTDQLQTFVGVLFYGGQAADESSAEWLEAGASQTRLVADAPDESRLGHAAVSLYDGRALVLGGQVEGDVRSDGVVVNPACLDDSDCAAIKRIEGLLATPRYDFTLTPYSTRYLLACGGRGAEGVVLDDCEIIDTENLGESQPFDPIVMVHARTDHDAVYLPDGTVMLVGGFNEEQGALDAVEIFVPPVAD